MTSTYQHDRPPGVGVYHRDIGFPPGTSWPAGTFPLRYSCHARREAREDRLGDFYDRLPRHLDMFRCQVVEAQIDGRGRVHLLVCRMPLDVERDIVLVVNTGGPVWFVRTVYLNRRRDQHRTLDRGRYDRPLKVA